MFVDVVIPPGLKGNGTARQARGRFRDMNLTRWTSDDGNTQPMGGWQKHGSADAMTGVCRSILPWKDNTGSRWIGLATHEKWYVQSSSGTQTDITPVGFTAGRPDAITGSGYGQGTYGTGAYGVPRSDSASVLAATVATQDLWNDRLVACWEEDGKLYEWDLSVGTPGAVIANAPTGCMGLVVTAEGFLVALKFRTVYWSDQGINTVWTPTTTNQAGDFPLNTPGVLMCGRKVRGKTLLFTTSDVWEMVYQNSTVVYGFTKAGSDCGPVSKGAVAALDDVCYWMGSGGFYVYNGAIQQLDCEVLDRVFANINRQQISKVTVWHNAQFNELWWHYPSAASVENDSYVYFNYRLWVWGGGRLARTAGAGAAGIFFYPLLVGSDGYVYDHENGSQWDGVAPYARTGPLEWPGTLGSGEMRTQIEGFIGDLTADGALDQVAQVTFYAKDTPDGPEIAFGPYSVSTGRTDVLFHGRLVELQLSFVGDQSARAGVNTLIAKPVSKR